MPYFSYGRKERLGGACIVHHICNLGKIIWRQVTGQNLLAIRISRYLIKLRTINPLLSIISLATIALTPLPGRPPVPPHHRQQGSLFT